ncbi:TetR/AcrR family transcriptional regulator [Parabacteroides sp. Marseille-P3160]|uniref:TetR/AcrR family transcriptional regulator n=1 Tax=Parabacteroides sp. Marseille-P3160 TaxID=1917887 RepID=UPI0009BB9AEA|nr:TetR/AcrR family transcriptional regulator [Parabacteroides sp. Marseille-P3160]
MENNNVILKDRATTENRLLDAVGEIIEEQGFENIGINAIAKKANVSKILIYRYFGSIEELIAQYILKKDYWINISTDMELADLGSFLKKIFREQIFMSRQDKLLKRLYRWELSSNNSIVEALREKREKNAVKLIELASELNKSTKGETAVFALLISSSISYLTMLEEVCPIYCTIPIQTDKGWEQIANVINKLIDDWIK